MKNKIRQISLVCWVLSLLIFVGTAIWMNNSDSTKPVYNYLVTIFLSDIAFGIVAFIVMLFAMANAGNKLVKEIAKEERVIEKVIIKQQPNFWMLLSVLLLVILAYILGNKNILISGFTSSATPTPVPTLIPVITTVAPSKVQNTTSSGSSGSQIECIGPDGKQFNTTMDNCKSLNEKWGKSVDYMLTCTFPVECGGGSKRMKKSECDVPCTRINTSSNTNTTVNTTSSNNSNKTAVYISYGGYTVYCPAQNVGAVMQIASAMESKKMEWATSYNQCSNTYTNSDSCWVNCKSNNTWSNCGTYGTPEYKACSDAVSASYSSCISACPSISAKCDYVYSEQRSMSNQINTLCK